MAVEDHDLLIQIVERVKNLQDTQKDFHDRVDKRIDEAWKVLDVHTQQLEHLRAVDTRLVGMASGAKWLWGAIIGLPALLTLWWHKGS